MASEERRVQSDLVEDGTLLRVVIDNPKGNILTMAVMRELSAVLELHASLPALRGVTLRGAGGHFSYGASVPEHRKEQAPEMLRGFHALCRQVAGYPVPISALVEGRCFGGAFEVVLCCTFVFCGRTSVFACPEIKLGVFPPVLAAIGAQRLGAPTMERLLLTGDEFTAESALRVGFATTVVDEDIEQAHLAWFRAKFRSLSAFTIRQATAAARASTVAPEGALGTSLDILEKRYVDKIVASHDGNEGITAFLERRSSSWRDA